MKKRIRLVSLVFILSFVFVLVGCKGAKGNPGEQGAQGEQGIHGAQGEQGAVGKSAYEYYLEKYPDYEGTEEQWLDDLVNGNLGTKEDIEYDVKFINEGNLIDELEILEGEKIPKPEDPKKEGYKFLGWYVGDEQWSFSGFVVTEDVALEAKWEILFVRVDENNNPDENGDYILFGLYPQTVVDDDNLIEALDELTQKNKNGYYEYEGNEYAKVVAKKFISTYRFNNNRPIIDGKVYYFKVEPIKWRILEQEDGTFTLLADMILDQKEFYPTQEDRVDGMTIYANNYKYSTLREWLNNDFYSKAFNDKNKELILTSFIDNSGSTTLNDPNPYACDDTYDKIYCLSYQEANDIYFDNDEEREAIATDYARAKNIYVRPSNVSTWWTRSPGWSQSKWVSTVALQIDSQKPDTSCYGARPALRIKIN